MIYSVEIHSLPNSKFSNYEDTIEIYKNHSNPTFVQKTIDMKYEALSTIPQKYLQVGPLCGICSVKFFCQTCKFYIFRDSSQFQKKLRN
jgi:hypothetical protein